MNYYLLHLNNISLYLKSILIVLNVHNLLPEKGFLDELDINKGNVINNTS